ncbi:Hypothetical protein, putative [Bodo saltans]|uniref:Uncharacterized protein n=1 Tax=Bodo saltans TaxID=75058 RepID=A0A0S4JFW3_BODSA|nr:Hypothetical protein, putative [Bodo saltans]|eukprot:CUG90392.1 Hypothetical protein, putative [Bodo saltans]
MTTILVFDYDPLCLGDFVSSSEVVEVAVAQETSLFWIRELAFLRDTETVLSDHGFEYEIPVMSDEVESGDVDRRKLYWNVMLKTVASVVEHESLEQHLWYEYVLCRMSCHYVERVTAYVRSKGRFSKSEEDLYVHKDILFVAYCGFVAFKDLHLSLTELYSSTSGDVSVHAMVPPPGTAPYVEMSWKDFYDEMCSDNPRIDAAMEVAKYAQTLIRFLIPSYVFALGPIPDPALWNFTFTAQDVTDLYHGHCSELRLAKVMESLTTNRCHGFAVDTTKDARTLRHQMWTLAYSTHVLLWGLLTNDRRLLGLLFDNSELLTSLDAVYDRSLNGNQLYHSTCLHYLLETRRHAMTARACNCANRPPWKRYSSASSPNSSNGSQCFCGGDSGKHRFYDDELLAAVVRAPEDLEKQIRSEAILWDNEKNLLHVLWAHCNDRVKCVPSESNGRFAMDDHWDKINKYYTQLQKNDVNFHLAVTLGTDIPTSDRRHGEGYDRMVHIMTASIRKLVLDVRQCHENVQNLNTKYWRYSGGERAVISIPYGSNVIKTREVQPSLLNNCRVVDIGLNLSGWYTIPDRATTFSQICQLEHNCDSAPSDRTCAPLKHFLLETARMRGGEFVLHGFCDAPGGGVHDVKINVTLNANERKGGKFEHLDFRVRVDNEDVQKATIITIKYDDHRDDHHEANGVDVSSAFLRLGIQLVDTGLGLRPDHIVHESADTLGAALAGEKKLQSEKNEVLTPEDRSRAMQVSPEMLLHLPLTQRGLSKFHSEHLFSQMQALESLFKAGGVRVLGLSTRDVGFAKIVLQDACYTVVNISIDDLSYATKYDFIKNLGTMSALSIIHLSVQSPLPRALIARLVDLTRNTSLRYIIEAARVTMPFFDDQILAHCSVQLMERRVCALDASDSFGAFVSDVSTSVLSGDAHLLLKEVQELADWANNQMQALALHAVPQMVPGTRLAIVVKGELHEIEGDVGGAVRDFGREIDQKQIQELLWEYPHEPVVVAVHTLEPQSTIFYDSRECSSVVEAVVFRPDLVASGALSGDARAATILGCRVDQLASLNHALAPLVTKVKIQAQYARASPWLVTFQAFIQFTPICEFLSHRFSELVDLVKSSCHNTYSSTIWESARLDLTRAIQPEPAFLAVYSSNGNLTASCDDAVSASVREGRPLNLSVLREWLRQVPTPQAFRQYIAYSLSPLAVFVLDPAVTASLLTPIYSDRGTEGPPQWACRLAKCLQSVLLTAAIKSPFLSVVRWVVTCAGGGALLPQSNDDAGADLDNVSALGVVIEFNDDTVNDLEVEFLATVLTLDSRAALHMQHRLNRFLTASPRNGGVLPSAADRIRSAFEPKLLGSLFIHVMLSAEEENTLIADDALHIRNWLCHSIAADLPQCTKRFLERLTPAAQVELLIASAQSGNDKWRRLLAVRKLLKAVEVPKMIDWLQRRNCTDDVQEHVRALLLPDDWEAFRDAFISQNALWPLNPIDSSVEAANFATMTCQKFLMMITAKLFTNDTQTEPNFEQFAATCELIRRTSSPSSQRYAVEMILAHRSHLSPQRSNWAFAALWMVLPLAPGHITTADASIVLLVSQFLSANGVIQREFANVAKENYESISPMALALIGWVEYVPTTMLCALSRLGNRMWSGRIAVEHVQTKRFLDPVALPGDKHSPPYAVAFVPRPIPLDQRAGLLSSAMYTWDVAPMYVSYNVSNGVSRAIVLVNLQYLNWAYVARVTGQPIPSHIFIGVSMINLWFACFGEDVSKIVELFDFMNAGVGQRDMSSFLDIRTSNLGLPSEMPPLIVDVQLHRPMAATRLMDLSSPEGRSYTRECLVVPFPAVDNEDWSFLNADHSFRHLFVEGFAKVSALRYVKVADDLLTKGKADEITMYANDVLQPCQALIAGNMDDLSKLYCRTVSECMMDKSVHRGKLAMAAFSTKQIGFLVEVLQPNLKISKAVHDEIDYFLRTGHNAAALTAAEHLRNVVVDTDEPIAREAAGVFGLDTIVREVRVQQGYRIEFPIQTDVGHGGKISVEPIAPVIFERATQANQVQANSAFHGDDDTEGDDAVRQHMNAELARKQFSGRSIDVKHILRLANDIRPDEREAMCFYLTLQVTAGAECYLVENNGNLEISSDLQDRRVLNVFKHHGEAWNFCKCRTGPVTLVGRGFFLYRSKENSGGWRFYIGRSVSNRAHEVPQNRFHFWHIAAYHAALCLPVPSALKQLLYVLAEAVHKEIHSERQSEDVKRDNQGELPAKYEDKIAKILQVLVSAKSEDVKRALNVAKPLLAYTRLLLSAAERMRISGDEQWNKSLESFHSTFVAALVPPRIGCIYDAEIDVLSCVRKHNIADPEMASSIPKDGVPDPAWFIPHRVDNMDLSESDLEIVRESRGFLSRIMKGDLRSNILDCVRKLSSTSSNAFAECVLSDGPIDAKQKGANKSNTLRSDPRLSAAEKLKHAELALHPLPVKETWSMLLEWTNESIRREAELLSETSGGGTDENFIKDLRAKRAEARNILRDAVKQNPTSIHVNLGEGIEERVVNEIEHCWVHEDDTLDDKSAEAAPHILWKDYDPDGFQVESGESIGFVIDALFCYRNPREEVPAMLPPLAGKHVTFTSVAKPGCAIVIEQLHGKTNIAAEGPVILDAQAGSVIIRFSAGDLKDHHFKIVPESTTRDCVRLESVVAKTNGMMLGPSRTENNGWTLYKPSRNSDTQFFMMTVKDESTSSADAQFRALMFRWVTIIIGAPLSLGWKAFFLHHTHVHSRSKPPAVDGVVPTPLIAYSVAQLCPAQKLRDQILGALSFTPNRFCRRRDKFFGVTVTPHKLDLQSKEWSLISDRVGPVTLNPGDTESEQYRTVVRNFSTQTTHVIVEGKATIPDRLLKWCCEFTKRFPWRFIVFVQCEVYRNVPENRDRVVDMNDASRERPAPHEAFFRADLRSEYITLSESEAADVNLAPSSRLLNWPQKIKDFIESESSRDGRVVLLVSPPGAGKTMELRNLEFMMKANKKRFVNFDCSGDALVQQSLVTLLDDSLLGIELGSDKVVLIADEYHMLTHEKKSEFLRWVETKLGAMKVVLIANRDDADDEFLNQRLRNVSSGMQPPSIIWRARVSTSKMLEALSTVRMNAPATSQMAVTFLSTIRTLISDDVVSLRMTSDMCFFPYGNERAPTSLEFAVRSKLQPENALFVSTMIQSFDRFYAAFGTATKHDIIDAYNQVVSPIDLLTFTAMLPVMLLWDPELDVEHQTCDTFLSFVEFVGRTSAYTVHPVVRLAAWASYVVSEVRRNLPAELEEHWQQRSVCENVEILRTLDIVDHPSFFPLIFEAELSKVSLDVCDTLIFPHIPTLDGIYDALVRHEALDWSLIKQQWARDPVTNLDGIVKIANPSIVAPQTVLMHLSGQNTFGLLQREDRRQGNDEGAFEKIVLSDYPAEFISLERDRASPYFWCVWNRTVHLPLDNDGKLWIDFIVGTLPPQRMTIPNEAALALRARFLFWVAAYGRISKPFPDAEQRTITAARVVSRLADACFISDSEHARLWRSDVIAPAAVVGAASDMASVLSIDLAFRIATHNRKRPHSAWPREMQLLARLADPAVKFTIDDVAHLSDFVTFSDDTPSRIIGAILQATPAGGLPLKLQQILLELAIPVDQRDLNADLPQDTIAKNVCDALLQRMKTNATQLFKFPTQCAVGVILTRFVAAHRGL